MMNIFGNSPFIGIEFSVHPDLSHQLSEFRLSALSKAKYDRKRNLTTS